MPDRRGHGRLVQRFFLYFNMYYISNQGKKAVRHKGQKEPFGAVQGSRAGWQEAAKRDPSGDGSLRKFQSAERLGSGMAFFVFLSHVRVGQVRIDLGSRDAGVPKQFLDVAQGCAVLQQVGGKAVAESMRSDA